MVVTNGTSHSLFAFGFSGSLRSMSFRIFLGSTPFFMSKSLIPACSMAWSNTIITYSSRVEGTAKAIFCSVLVLANISERRTTPSDWNGPQPVFVVLPSRYGVTACSASGVPPREANPTLSCSTLSCATSLPKTMSIAFLIPGESSVCSSSYGDVYAE